MKKFLLVPLLAVLVAGYCLAQNMTLPQKIAYEYALLDKTQVSTGYLFDLSIPLATPAEYHGTPDSKPANIDVFGMLYGELLGSYVGTGNHLPDPSVYMTKIRALKDGDAIPLTIMALRYDYMRSDAAALNLVTYTNKQIHDVPGRTKSPYLQDTVIVTAPLTGTANTRKPVFTLPADLWFTNLTGVAPVISFDAGDGQGWHILSPGNSVSADYLTAGDKELTIKLQYPGLTRYGHSRLKIMDVEIEERSGGMNWPRGLYESIVVTSSKTFTEPGGHTAAGVATMHIFYNQSNCNNAKRMLRPLIVVEGYEEGGVASSSYSRMFSLLDLPVINGTPPTDNLTDYLYPSEYDLIYVDFADGSDWIQRNAFALEEVIKKVNAMKAQSGSMEKNVIIGVSMGGIAGKYALLDMKKTGLNHDTRLFITYDAPLRGANIPIGTQCLIRFLREQLPTYGGSGLSIPTVEAVWQAIWKGVPQQLLKYHVMAIDQADPVDGEPINPVHVAFMAEMDALGALDMRHVALSNGSGIGTFLENNMKANEVFFSLFGIKDSCAPLPLAFCGHVAFNLKIKATGWNIVTDVFEGYVEKTGPFSELSILWRPSVFTKPYDVMPGGTSNLGVVPLGSGLMDALNNAGVVTLGPGLTATHHCFIPAFSSVSAAEPGNFGAAQPCGVVNRCTTASTATPCPFSGSPEINQFHVALDSRIANILIDELVTMSPAPFMHPFVTTSQLNTYFNVGQLIYSPIPTVTIGTTTTPTGTTIGKLSINNTGKVGYASGNEPNSPLNLLIADTRCNAVITVQNGGSLVIGADGSAKHGQLNVGEGSIVHIEAGGTLQITSNQSMLWIKKGAQLIIDAGAIVNLESPESNIRMEGELIWNGNIQFKGLGFFDFYSTNKLSVTADAFRLIGTLKNNRYIRIQANAALIIPDGKGIDLQKGAVQDLGIIKLGINSFANFRSNYIYGAGEELQIGIQGTNTGNFKMFDGLFEKITHPIVLNGSTSYLVTKTEITQTTFRSAGDGTATEMVHRGGVAYDNCRFEGTYNGGSYKGIGIVSKFNLVFTVRDCKFKDYRGQLESAAEAGILDLYSKAVDTNGDWIIWMNGGEIDNCSIGIGNVNVVDEAPVNIYLSNRATIRNCYAGVAMRGNSTNGQVIMDCARLINNSFGIFGYDATLLISPFALTANDGHYHNPNVFIRPTIPTNTPQFIHVCYVTKPPINSLPAGGNYWGRDGGGGVYQDMIPNDHIWLKRNECSTSFTADVSQPLEREPLDCLEDHLTGPNPDDCTLLAVYPTTTDGTVRGKYRSGLDQVKTE